MALPGDPGRLVKATASETEKGRNRLVIDLSAVPNIDSTGLSVLVQSLKQVRDSNGKMMLVINTPKLGEVLETTRLIRIFDVADNLETAVKQVSE
jgi:anti-anti-sigma factor